MRKAVAGFNQRRFRRHVTHDPLVRLREGSIAAAVDQPRDFDRFTQVVRFRAAVCHEAVAGAEIGGNLRSGEAAVESHISAGGEAGQDSGSRVIANERAQKSPAGREFISAAMNADFAERVFQVAGGRPRPKIYPSAEVAVAEKSLVCFVGIAVQD